jgi:hypothetical protein
MSLFKDDYAKFIMISVFFMPCFFIIVLFNFVVDPFNINKVFDFGFAKNAVSYNADHRLYKMLEYDNNPLANILLGDSRIEKFDVKIINKYAGGGGYYNFMWKASNVHEMMEIFWHTTEKTSLKNVYFFINFDAYNANKGSIFAERRNLAENALPYYTSLHILKISAMMLFKAVAGIDLTSDEVSVSKEDFWEQQLDNYKIREYSRYTYPQNAYERLLRIKRYCDDNDINLTFVVLPTHVDWQNKVREYNLEAAYARYKEDLKGLSATIDYDYDNEWTRDKDLFRDPYHFDNFIMESIVAEIWGGQLKIGKVLEGSGKKTVGSGKGEIFFE